MRTRAGFLAPRGGGLPSWVDASHPHALVVLTWSSLRTCLSAKADTPLGLGSLYPTAC
jgi:hypothetical protein